MGSLPLHIDHVLRVNGFQLDDARKNLLAEYTDLLLEWNRRINLVSRRDSQNIWEGHILHSLSPLFMLQIPEKISVLDLGSGGGLPGVPLAIVRDDLKVTLLDSIQKKVRVLEDIIQKLGLRRVDAVCARAEEAGREGGLAGSFDAVIARAVAPLDDLVRWSRPFLRRRGVEPTRRTTGGAGAKDQFLFPYLLALKGGDLEREIRDARMRAGGTITEIELVFPGSEDFNLVDKKLVVVEYSRT